MFVPVANKLNVAWHPADNVGGNVGDIAGMGADLYGSFAESTCACLVIAAQSCDFVTGGWRAICFPLLTASAGMVVCATASIFATEIFTASHEHRIELVLRLQLVITAVLILPAVVIVGDWSLPATFHIDGVSGPIVATRDDAIACVVLGAVGGLLIAVSTEFYTNKTCSPVKHLAASCAHGASINIINGLAIGYDSVVIPVFILAAVTYYSFARCDVYGVSLAAIGMLANLATALTLNAFGSVSDHLRPFILHSAVFFVVAVVLGT